MRRSPGLLAALSLLVAACGGGAAPAAATSAPAAATSAPAASTSVPATSAAAASGGATVNVQGFAFKPASLEVAAGTTVTWTNMDGTGHTTTSGAPGAKDGKWEGQLAGSGGAFSFKFTTAGTFAYFCAIHGASMTGVVIVK
jgi:plastocyanin